MLCCISKCMSELKQKVSKTGRGGARPGAGRPKGNTDRVSVDQIMTSLEQHSGQTYADTLALDFMEARAANDRSTVMKYHNLILNKVAPTLQSVEVVNSETEAETRQAVFQEALAKLTALSAKAK